MSQTLTLELDDEVYATIERRARRHGTSAARWLATALHRSEDLLRKIGISGASIQTVTPREGRERFERHFGEIDLGRPTGTDNERIDDDLAKAYEGI